MHQLFGCTTVAILIVNIGAGLVMALVFFMGSDYAIGGLSVAGLDAEVYKLSIIYMCFYMSFDSTCIFCFISTITYSYSICLSGNRSIVFHNYNVRYPGLSCCGMLFPCMFMNRL